jgi:hypothetical protein
MLSYEDNEDFALQTKYILKRDWDIDCEIIFGYKVDEHHSKNKVLMQGVTDFLLPKALEHGEDIYYIEDDVRFTSHPMLIPTNNYDVIWSGYRKGKLTNKSPHNVITGSQAIYIKKDILKLLYDNFNNRKNKIHIDRAFSYFFNENPKINVLQTKKSICYEKEHKSLISKDDWSKYTKPR